MEAAEHYGVQLKEQGIAYEKFDSGNRSIHYHVPVVPIVGDWVPRAVYDYECKHIDGCDLSIYRHTGLFRLEGTWHEKNPGHRKQLLAKASGRSVVIEKPESYQIVRTGDDQGTHMQFIINKRIDTGGRRCYAYNIGSTCFKRGLPKQQALELALKWNNACAKPPLDPEIVWQKVEEAYR